MAAQSQPERMGLCCERRYGLRNWKVWEKEWVLDVIGFEG